MQEQSSLFLRGQKFGFGFFLVVLLSGLVSISAQSSKHLVFASDATYPPMEFVDDKQGVVGFDADLTAAVAKAGGFTYEIKNQAWDGIFAALKSKQYQAIVSSVSITDERKANFDFSEPYLNAGQMIIARNDNPKVKSLADLSKGTTVGIQLGTTGDKWVSGQKGLQKKSYDEIGLAIEDLFLKRIDAVVVDSPIAANYVLRNDKYKTALRLIGKPLTDEWFGYVVNKGDKANLDLINKGLAKVKADGTLEKLKKKWLEN